LYLAGSTEFFLETAFFYGGTLKFKFFYFTLIVGEKEAENEEVSVRKQGEGDQGTMKIEDFAKNIAEEVHNMINKW
jgi:threonyl-tRNA synthetase